MLCGDLRLDLVEKAKETFPPDLDATALTMSQLKTLRNQQRGEGRVDADGWGYVECRSTPDEGGETMFPRGLPKAEGPGWSECAKQGFSVKAVKGNALLFYE